MSELFDPPTASESKPCAWCGEETHGTIEVEKPRYGKAANGTRVVKRRAIVAPCCLRCAKRLAPSDEEEAVIA